jgi:hypothetical protein
MLTAAPLATLILGLSFTVFFAGRDLTYLPLAQLQTLIFVMLVFTGLGNVYLVRECHHFWQSRPSRWLMSGHCSGFGSGLHNGKPGHPHDCDQSCAHHKFAWDWHLLIWL